VRILGIMDRVDKATRSRMMAGIRSVNTAPEIAVRKFLHSQGFRYRLHDKKLSGRPDIVLTKYRVTIFVHGCFWHQHSRCKYAVIPQSNVHQWTEKFASNKLRDEKVTTNLTTNNWRVILIWECGLRRKDSTTELAWLVEAITQSSDPVIEWPFINL
jgi:DNA mismatch endonuclease (patch repair protein)